MQLLSEVSDKVVAIDCRLDLENLVAIEALVDTENYMIEVNSLGPETEKVN